MMKAARKRGNAIGRPRKLAKHQLAYARQLIESSADTRTRIAELLGGGVATLRRALNGRTF